MKEHTFSVGNKPRVVIRRVQGDVLVHPWNERVISVRIAGENEDGSTVQPYNEGDTVFITDCTGSVELYVPYEKGLFGVTSLTTDISITDLDGRVSMERVGNVDVTNISGEVMLSYTEGHLRATNTPRVVEDKGIGASATLENVSRIEIKAIGSSLDMRCAEVVKVGSVGSSVRGTEIGASFSCGNVGSACEIANSPHADISVSNVGGALQLEDASLIGSCNVGGSLTALVNMPENAHASITVGGSANLSLPHNANLRMRIMAGGSISGEAVNQKRNNMATLTYGNGSASLTITAGGNVKLSWTADSARYDIREEQPSKDKAQQRQAILTMVQQGRITPEEGNMLLEAIG